MNLVTVSDQQTTYQHRKWQQRICSRLTTLLGFGLTSAIVVGGA
jgi:hypothetical protein